MAQIDVQSFVEDPEVQGIIEKGRGTVYIGEGSDAGLTAGGGEIAGLKPDKYYMVEELAEDDSVVKFAFVTQRGSFGQLKDIGKVPGGKVTGLANHTAYRVTSAKPLYEDGAALKCFDLEANNRLPAAIAGKTVEVIDGAITLPPPKERFFIDLSSPADSPVSVNRNYGVMMAPDLLRWGNSRVSAYFNDYTSDISQISLGTRRSNESYEKADENKDIGIYQYRQEMTPAYLEGMSMVGLTGADTQADYIIIEYRSSDGFPAQFAYLTAIIGEEVEEPGARIGLSIEYSGDNSPQIAPSHITYRQDEDKTITFTVTGAEGYANIEWFIDGEPVGTAGAASFVLDTGNVDYKMAGTYTLTVTAEKDGMPLSTAVEITVTGPD